MLKALLAISLLISFGCGQSPGNFQNESRLNLADDDRFVLDPWWSYDKEGDPRLSGRHALSKYFKAAKQKKLALNYFRDLIGTNAKIAIRHGDWPKYQPGIFSGGTIYHPAVGKSFDQWNRLDWSSFYNELFHAWWGSSFTKSSKYADARNALLTSERRQHYRRAHPRNPLLAQEEAYSETIATLMIYAYPQYNPEGPESRYFNLPFFVYQKNKTVAAVSHSDRPGFTPEAETTYPNIEEYRVMFRLLFDAAAP